jgi:hypothetical protein
VRRIRSAAEKWLKDDECGSRMWLRESQVEGIEVAVAAG